MIDWWSFGILLFEVYVGVTPFRMMPVQKILKRLTAPEPLDLSMMNRAPQRFQSLVQQLLEKDPKKRLCALKGASEIKDHEFFRKVDWEKVKEKETKPIFTYKLLGDKLPQPTCQDPENPGLSILIQDAPRNEDLVD